jgi:hypothetical protein
VANVLKDLVEKIQVEREQANRTPEDFDYKVRNAADGVIRAAQEQVRVLENEYRNEVYKHIMLISVEGKGAAEFAKHASKMNLLSFNFQELTDELTDRLKARRAGEHYTTSEHALFLMELVELKNRYRLTSIPSPVINDIKNPVYNQPLRLAVETILKSNYGDELFAAVTRRKIERAALEQGFFGKTLAVVVYNLKGDLPPGNLLPAPAFVIEAPAKVTVDFVKNELLKLRNTLKGVKSEDKSEEHAEKSEQQPQTQEGNQ